MPLFLEVEKILSLSYAKTNKKQTSQVSTALVKGISLNRLPPDLSSNLVFKFSLREILLLVSEGKRGSSIRARGWETEIRMKIIKMFLQSQELYEARQYLQQMLERQLLSWRWGKETD